MIQDSDLYSDNNFESRVLGSELFVYVCVVMWKWLADAHPTRLIQHDVFVHV